MSITSKETTHNTQRYSSTMHLQDQIDSLRQEILRKLPKPMVQTIQQAIDELIASGIDQGAARKGDIAPEFQLPNAVGKAVGLSEMLNHGPVVLSFYRGEWCPYCNLELHALQQVLPEIKALGATLIAISPQSPDRSLTTVEKHQLAFEVLSDNGNRVARSYGLAYRLPDSIKPVLEELDIDLTAYNRDNPFELPMPATYVVDRTRRVRAAFVHADYTKRTEPEDILHALHEMLSDPA